MPSIPAHRPAAVIAVRLMCLSAPGLFLVAACCCAAAPVTVTYYGGAGMVSGSLAEITTPAGSILFDCGEVIGDDRQAIKDEALARRLTAARALVISHAHRDHTGRFLALAEQGFSGDVYCTSATRTLMGLTLSARGVGEGSERVWFWSRRARSDPKARIAAHWRRECPGLRKMRPANMVFFNGTLERARAARAAGLAACRSCIRLENAALVNRSRLCAYGRSVELLRGVRVTLLDAGHIPGSASALFEIDHATTVIRILFSGDLGPRQSLFQSWDSPAPPADAVFIESTYGGIEKNFDIAADTARFEEALGRALAGGGIAVMPAFALDRAQKALFLTRTAQARGLLPKGTKVYCPAPRAREITQWYESVLRSGALFRPGIAAAGGIAPDGLRGEWPRDAAGPAVCVVSPGMPALRITRAALRKGVPVTVFLMGHDANNDGAQSLPPSFAEITGARIEYFEFLSSHADAADAAFWLSAQSRGTPVYVVHGTPERLSAQRAYLAACGHDHVSAAERGEALLIKKGEAGALH